MNELMANFKYCINKHIKEVIENKRDRVLSIDCQTWECVVAVGLLCFTTATVLCTHCRE